MERSGLKISKGNLMEKYVVEITPQNCGWVFEEYGTVTTDERILIKYPEKVSLVVFTGGHDVSPHLYGENVGRWTYSSNQRDIYEGKMFDQAQKYNIPCVGICRGSQFLCVKAGGKLVQDISGHAGATHRLMTNEGKTIMANSTHHQMQLPPKGAVPLAWSAEKLSVRYLNGDDKEIEVDREYEVVYYPNINSVGIQFHPEYCSSSNECVLYSQEVVKKYLFSK